METQGYDPLSGTAPDQWICVKGQLASPIGLGHQWSSEAQAKGAPFFVRTVIAHLRYGLLYYYYAPSFPEEGPTGGEFGPVKSMFPLTPVELGEGFIVGRERIVTCISRSFNRPEGRRPKVRLFDERGRAMTPKAGQITVARNQKGWRVGVRLRDWWQIAVVE